MRELDYREAMIWASGEILAQPFPDDWEKYDDFSLYRYIDDNVSEFEQGNCPEHQWSRISRLADSVNRLIKELKDG